MRKLTVGAAALVALGVAAPATAADMRVAAAPPPAPVYTWSGCYVGASAGTSSGNSTHYTTAGSTLNNPASALNVLLAGANITDRFNLSGFIGGFQGGCNYQAGVWVFGVEVDGSATNKEGQACQATSGIGPWAT